MNAQMNEELGQLFIESPEKFDQFLTIRNLDLRSLAMQKKVIPALTHLKGEFEGFDFQKDLNKLSKKYGKLCWVRNEKLKEKNLQIFFEFEQGNTNFLIGGFVYCDHDKKSHYDYTKLQQDFKEAFKAIPVKTTNAWPCFFHYWRFMYWANNPSDLKNLIFGDFKEDLKSKIKTMLEIFDKVF